MAIKKLYSAQYTTCYRLSWKTMLTSCFHQNWQCQGIFLEVSAADSASLENSSRECSFRPRNRLAAEKPLRQLVFWWLGFESRRPASQLTRTRVAESIQGDKTVWTDAQRSLSVDRLPNARPFTPAFAVPRACALWFLNFWAPAIFALRCPHHHHHLFNLCYPSPLILFLQSINILSNTHTLSLNRTNVAPCFFSF